MKVQSFSKKQAGFTLIELVVVIVILGILAVTAIPRFTDMTKDARIAAINGVFGAVQSSAAIAHAQALVKGQTDATGTITMEGQTINLAYGYPTTADISKTLSSTQGFDTATTAGTISLLNGTTLIANCNVAYVQTAAANTPPTITKTDSGC
ncbi:type II secretion system protein [Oxalicibacterium solurbis]|uniref:Type II secretion system protein n=1 Tax=Oxalicibacterium solurbis TaxID=69280 RepID=A0A8J3AVS2_9BURK|nr:prepilin-type N-terminal cleavage/methylation domain-containing protein [Oxalicibacterium solurbis]GGI53096.1 hypothetical protein GCM10011430_02700 [Oxalicibacterium solurbis]